MQPQGDWDVDSDNVGVVSAELQSLLGKDRSQPENDDNKNNKGDNKKDDNNKGGN